MYSAEVVNHGDGLQRFHACWVLSAKGMLYQIVLGPSHGMSLLELLGSLPHLTEHTDIHGTAGNTLQEQKVMTNIVVIKLIYPVIIIHGSQYQIIPALIPKQTRSLYRSILKFLLEEMLYNYWRKGTMKMLHQSHQFVLRTKSGMFPDVMVGWLTH